MSQGRGSTEGEKRKRSDIELSQVVMFLHFISVMTGALFCVSTIFFLLCAKTPETNVVWGMTIGVNFIAAAGAFFSARMLDKKDRELTEKEIEKKLSRPEKQAEKKKQDRE